MLISEVQWKDQETQIDLEEDLIIVMMPMQALKKNSERNFLSAQASVEPTTDEEALQKLVSVMSKPKKSSTGFLHFKIFEKEILPYLSVLEIRGKKKTVVVHTFLKNKAISYSRSIQFDSKGQSKKEVTCADYLLFIFNLLKNPLLILVWVTEFKNLFMANKLEDF
jgi:hypothetical protein